MPRLTLIQYVKSLQKSEGLTHVDYAKKLNLSRGALLYIYRTGDAGTKFLSGVLHAYEHTKHFSVLVKLVSLFLISNITKSKGNDNNAK